MKVFPAKDVALGMDAAMFPDRPSGFSIAVKVVDGDGNITYELGAKLSNHQLCAFARNESTVVTPTPPA